MVGMGAFHVAMVGLLQWLVGVGAGSCEKNETFCAVASQASRRRANSAFASRPAKMTHFRNFSAELHAELRHSQ